MNSYKVVFYTKLLFEEKILEIQKEWAQKFFEILSFETMAGQNWFSIKVMGIGVSLILMGTQENNTILVDPQKSNLFMKCQKVYLPIWVNQYLPSTILKPVKNFNQKTFSAIKICLSQIFFSIKIYIYCCFYTSI